MSTIFAKRIGGDKNTPIEYSNPRLGFVGLKVNIGIKSPGNPGNIVNVENVGDNQFYVANFDYEETMRKNGISTNSSLKDLFLQCNDMKGDDYVEIVSL